MSQPPFSLLKRDAEREEFPLCAREGIGVVPYQVLQGGLLTGKYRRCQAPPPATRMAEKKEWMGDLSDATYDAIEEVARGAEAEGTSMTHYAVAWTLARPGVTSVLIGARRPEQLAEPIAAAGG